MKPRLYIETSVVSYYAARPSRDLIVAGHQQITQQWWVRQLSWYEPYVSEVVREEISRGDAMIAKLRLQAVQDFADLAVTPDVTKLARKYYAALDLPDKARLDAIHLALAVQHGMDYLVSWNFAHIAGARPRGIVQKINYQMQMETPVICTPEELIQESL
ncbi:MAG: type II toxin-antitoxin system VapC family toxin [Sedimentisphaerales bacterium]|nr:type II toxin-antitoxin system VapC family toxin [Sedimentisphaerales bacterium]